MHDHCATLCAASALWSLQMNNTEQAVDICNADVIERILPVVEQGNADGSNWLGLTYLLSPCVEVLRSQGFDGAKRAWELFMSHLCEPYNSRGIPSETGARYFITPLRILLQCGSRSGTYDGIDRDVDWILDEGNKMSDAYEDWVVSGELK